MSSLETEFEIPTEFLDPNFQSCSAITRCRNAWDESLKTWDRPGRPYGRVLEDAQAAYCRAMPQLLGGNNIRDFVACVANGLLLGAITESQSSRLLYAAQVAQGVLRARTNRKASA
jgi:hypothetical protein